MTNDEHQRERMRHWSASFLASTALCAPHQNADMALAEFDKRFPAPAEQADDAGFNYKDVASADVTVAELATLRDKARLWDAVASGKVRVFRRIGVGYIAEFSDGMWTKGCPTAAEAVEDAIAAGALK